MSININGNNGTVDLSSITSGITDWFSHNQTLLIGVGSGFGVFVLLCIIACCYCCYRCGHPIVDSQAYHPLPVSSPKKHFKLKKSTTDDDSDV